MKSVKTRKILNMILAILGLFVVQTLSSALGNVIAEKRL